MQEDQTAFVDRVREILPPKLKISLKDLCSRIKPPEKKDIDLNDLRKLIFCDFGDAKADEKFYKEITDIEKTRTVNTFD